MYKNRYIICHVVQTPKIVRNLTHFYFTNNAAANFTERIMGNWIHAGFDSSLRKLSDKSEEIFPKHCFIIYA